MNNEMRERFETWVLGESYRRCDLAKIKGHYQYHRVRTMWLGWQAAEKSKQAEIDALKVYPMQPIAKDKHGRFRFETNPIVDEFLSPKLNEIAVWCQMNDIDNKYQEQLAQLIGYSLDGYGTLSYASDESFYRAAETVEGES